MQVVERYAFEDKVVEICVDECPENPREEMDCAGTLWCWHTRYSFGNKQERQGAKSFDPSSYSGWEALEAAIRKEVKPVVLLPVYMYDHGGVAFSTRPFGCRWDSGQVGFIFAKRDQLKNWGAKIATAKVKEMITAALEQEIKTYAAYANGDVLGWRCGEDSCWGYYGLDEIPYMLEVALGAEAAKKASAVR